MNRLSIVAALVAVALTFGIANQALASAGDVLLRARLLLPAAADPG